MASRPEASSPAAPSALSWGDIMDREDPLPSSPPSSTLSWGDIMDIEDPLPSSPPSSTLSWGDIMDIEDPLPSSPPPLSALSWGDIMDAEDPLPSSPPTASVLTWGEIMDAEDPLPSSPPTASAFRWGEVMDADDVKMEEREKKEQSKKVVQQEEKSEDIEEKMKVKVIIERKNPIQEVEERKKQAKNHQQLPDKTTESSVDKSCHSKNTKTLKLFIKNLDYSVDDERLYKEFVPFGAIISAKVMMENGRSKGFGYITFSCVREAMAAMSEMDGVTLGRRQIYVSLSSSPSRKEPKPYPAQTVQRTGSGQPTKPRLSPEKETRRVRPQRPLYVVPARLERKKENK